ncbi:MAG: hypothetical protein ACLQM8_20180 [Limisphaerales bacterium]
MAPELPDSKGGSRPFVEPCAPEAIGGPATGSPRLLPRQESQWTDPGFLRVLRQEGRDREGRLLAAGTAVLGHPSEPEVFCEDTPARRKEFLDLDCAWSEPARQGIWFPKPAALPAELNARFDELRSFKRAYLAAIEENLASSRGRPFPFVRVPKWFHALPYEWEPKVKRIEPGAGLTDGFFEIARKQSGARSDLNWPAEWVAQFKELNAVKVYSLSGFASEAYVVAAFVTRFHFQRQGMPEALPLDQAWFAALEEAYNRWMAAQANGRPNFTFFAIGTGGAPAGPMENVTAGGHWAVVAWPGPDGRWTSPELEKFPRRLSLRDFLERLLPETQEQRLCRIKECVDGLLIEGGNVTVERVKRETGYRRSAVREAFFQLQKGACDLYRLWRKDGELAIRKAAKGEPVRIASASFGRRFVRRHFLGIIGVALGSALGLLAGWLATQLGLTGYVGFMLGLLIAYAGSCAQNEMNRRADMQKEWG